jgi:uncharacterized membrane protein
MAGATASLKRRWPAIALVASLVLNGFLAGMLATDWLRPRRGFTGERLATFELRRLDERLPKDAIDRIAAELRPLGPELDERIRALRAMREEILRLAAAPTPDRAAIDARLAELRAAASEMQQTVQRATYDALLKLPPEVRAVLARGETSG